jgi:hypothetical protein
VFRLWQIAKEEQVKSGFYPKDNQPNHQTLNWAQGSAQL